MATVHAHLTDSFPHMPEHAIPFRFGVDIGDLARKMNRVYQAKSRRSRTRLTQTLLQIFTPIASVDEGTLQAHDMQGEAYSSTIGGWYSGSTSPLWEATAVFLEEKLNSVSMPSSFFFSVDDIIDFICTYECWYLEDHDDCDYGYNRYRKTDFGSKLYRYCQINAQEEQQALKSPLYRENLKQLQLLLIWQEVLQKYQETGENSIASIAKQISDKKSFIYASYLCRYEYYISLLLEARVFGLCPASPWCPDNRAANLYSRSPFDDSYTRLILNNRWAFRQHLLERARFVV